MKMVAWSSGQSPAWMHAGAHRHLSFVAAVLVLIGAVGLAGCRGRVRTEYYVSPTGSDSSGVGSMSRPWRHIQYALDHIDYTASPAPRLNLLKGIYEERVVVRNSIFIQGAGVGPISVLPAEPLIPIGDVSLIARPSSVDHGDPGFVIEDVSGVTLADLVIGGGRVLADNAAITIDNIEVVDSEGEYGVRFLNSTFFMFNSRVWTRQPLYWSDLGIDIDGSTGALDGVQVGDHFDHVINVIRSTNVSILNSEITGSPITYADGIRVQSPTTIHIANTSIIRDADGAEAAAGSHNRPFAGIEMAGANYSGLPGPLARIEGVTTAGFDVGLGVNMRGFRLRVENSNLSGQTYASQTLWRPSTGPAPLVDMGGGVLGSNGGNTFGATGLFGLYHQGSYDIDACDNDWGVPIFDVNERIFDTVDDPSLGRVFWLGCFPDSLERRSAPETTGEATPTAVSADRGAPSVPELVSARVNQNAFCRAGDHKDHPAVHTYLAGDAVELDAINSAGTWFRTNETTCWIAGSLLDIDLPYSLPTLQPPPPPTPTYTPVPMTSTPEPPAAPSNLMINNEICSQTEYTITLSWQDNANNEDGFRVYYNGSLIATLGPNTTSYKYAVPSDSSATYAVEAFNEAGSSGQVTVGEDGCLV